MYSVKDLSQITGLTPRTLRNYIASGILQGTKEKDIWQFTEGEVADFLKNPAVRPSVQAKQSGILYDFEREFDNTENEVCILFHLSLSPKEAKKKADFFCAKASRSQHIRFSYLYEKGKAKFILKGEEQEIRDIMLSYYAE